MSRCTLIISCMLLTLNFVYAQSARTIRGEVHFENRSPAANVTVKVKDGLPIAVTDERGVNVILAGDTASLVISLVGLQKKERSEVVCVSINFVLQDQLYMSDVL